jgi:hypothetical protein
LLATGPGITLGAGPRLTLLPPLVAFDLINRSDTDAISTTEFVVENLFIFIFPGPTIVGACLGISTSHTLIGTLLYYWYLIPEQMNHLS